MKTIVRKNKTGFSVKAYVGDAKTLLAFNLPKPCIEKLAGFTLSYAINGKGPFYLSNNLRFKDPARHAQDHTRPANASINAPIHKFRWIHIPGSLHQGTAPYYGKYAYTVTPRYFDVDGALLPIDRTLGVTVTVPVGPFETKSIALGFARGFTQSQAFTHHFGPKALVRPKDLIYDTSKQAGTNSQGEAYTFDDEYAWLGYTARTRIFDLLNQVLANPKLHVDVFAYDFNETNIVQLCLALAKEGRIRIILDNAALHHTAGGTKPEDQFEKLFQDAAVAPAGILRGSFYRYAHDKELIISKIGAGGKRTPVKVLTGSTNFSVTGMYVNSNHVLVFNDPTVAAAYQDVFDVAWDAAMWGGKKSKAFAQKPEAKKTFSFGSAKLPKVEITYSPHPAPFATSVLQGIADRVTAEAKLSGGSVLFAVMAIDAKSTGPVFPALRTLHQNQSVFSYGITDTQDGIALYKPGSKTGVLVTGKPAKSVLPPPFDQIPFLGLGHQVHHKFVVCGFNTPDAVVYCGSSNLALGGEQENGDNLIAIHDSDIATVFAIEALGLVDHFNFLDNVAENAKATGQVSAKVSPETTADKTKSSSKQQQAADAGWFLSTTGRWAAPYYDPNDLHCIDRMLFGA